MADEEDWFDLFEDYFGTRIRNQGMWERELERQFPDVDNDQLCKIIRQKARELDHTKKVTLENLRAWVRDVWRKPTMDKSGCTNCRNTGWMSFTYRKGKVIVYDMPSMNATAIPCVCPMGEESAQRVSSAPDFDAEHLRNSQDIVLAAIRRPVKWVHPVDRLPSQHSVEPEPLSESTLTEPIKRPDSHADQRLQDDRGPVKPIIQDGGSTSPAPF